MVKTTIMWLCRNPTHTNTCTHTHTHTHAHAHTYTHNTHTHTHTQKKTLENFLAHEHQRWWLANCVCKARTSINISSFVGGDGACESETRLSFSEGYWALILKANSWYKLQAILYTLTVKRFGLLLVTSVAVLFVCVTHEVHKVLRIWIRV